MYTINREHLGSRTHHPASVEIMLCLGPAKKGTGQGSAWSLSIAHRVG